MSSQLIKPEGSSNICFGIYLDSILGIHGTDRESMDDFSHMLNSIFEHKFPTYRTHSTRPQEEFRGLRYPHTTYKLACQSADDVPKLVTTFFRELEDVLPSRARGTMKVLIRTPVTLDYDFDSGFSIRLRCAIVPKSFEFPTEGNNYD